MRIKWFAHASFLIEGDGLKIITDPYTPEVMGFAPVTESADIVIRSSSDDIGHCNAPMIPGNPVVVTATEILERGARVHGLAITAIPVQESLVYKTVPLTNAMYHFELEGIRVAHFGDVGNRLTDDQIRALEGSEVLLVPTGGPPTIDLDDLYDAIRFLRPKLVVPMHYHLPHTIVKMLPVTEFTRRFPPSEVDWIADTHVEITRAALPAKTRVAVLRASSLNQPVFSSTRRD